MNSPWWSGDSRPWGTARRFLRMVLRWLACCGLMGCLLAFPGCASTPNGTPGAGAPQPGIEKAGTEPAAAGKQRAPRVSHVETIKAVDLVDRTLIKIIADGPFHGYRFERPKRRHFVLRLDDVSADLNAVVIGNESAVVKNLAPEKAGPLNLVLNGTTSREIRDYDVRVEGRVMIVSLFIRGKKTVTGSGKAKRLARTAPVSMGTAGMVGPSLAPPLNSALGTGRGNYSGKRISLDLQNADVVNVLRLLADISGKNIVIEPDVTGRVTLKVDKVPWDQILSMVLEMNQLGEEQLGDVIRIAKRSKLKQELKAKREEVKNRMELYRAQQELQIASADTGEIMTEYLQVNYSNIDEIAKKILEFKSPMGRATIDSRTNLIIYSDYPARIEMARELLQRLDRPNKQVLIEARIVELTTNATRELGVTWSFGVTNNNDYHVAQYFAINHPIVPSSVFGFNVGKLVGQPLWNIDMQLQAAERSGDARIISAPRVLTMDNVKAVITQGTEIPYNTPTGLVTSDQSGNLATVVTTTFKKADLELQVTPHVTPDRRILLDINAKKDRPDFSAVGPGEAPPINTRSIKTQLLVDDRDTVVIGGVLEETEEVGESRTPGLHNLPVLGNLFKSQRQMKKRVELLIFISPRIVEGEG